MNLSVKGYKDKDGERSLPLRGITIYRIQDNHAMKNVNGIAEYSKIFLDIGENGQRLIIRYKIDHRDSYSSTYRFNAITKAEYDILPNFSATYLKRRNILEIAKRNSHTIRLTDQSIEIGMASFYKSNDSDISRRVN